jgi:hypothetical protein
MRWEILSKLVSSTASGATIYRDLCSKGWANLLNRQAGVFRTLSKQTSDALIDSFWKYSYPFFPLFNWEQFSADYSAGSISPLLLNAVFMVSAFHCPEPVLHDAGFPSIYLASFTFYRRAKALYDTDNELDGVSIVQATILMSEWWGGPMEQKDTWYWLGVAATLAQSLGIHRS